MGVKQRSRREQQLERLRRSLEGGTYAVDPQRVAAAILSKALEKLHAAAN